MQKVEHTEFEKEILALIETLDEDCKRVLFQDKLEWKLEPKQTFNSLGIAVKHLAQHGGEDEGRDYWTVYKFSRDGLEACVKFDGWYASYHGSEFTEAFIVRPTQKMVTVFE